MSAPMLRRAMWLSLTVAFGFGALGCGGGGTLRAQVYRDAEATYHVGELGAGWERIDLDQNDLAWHSASMGAIVQVNATCDPFQDVPLTSLTNHLLIGFTDRDLRAQELQSLMSHFKV